MKLIHLFFLVWGFTHASLTTQFLEDNIERQRVVRIDTANILLLKESSGRFVPSQMYGWAEKTMIMRDGRVIKSRRENNRSPWRDVEVDRLTLQATADLARLTATLSRSALSFPDDDRCADTPYTSFSARNQDGELVEFAAHSGYFLGLVETFHAAKDLVILLNSY